jgi:hypothetical protein
MNEEFIQKYENKNEKIENKIPTNNFKINIIKYFKCNICKNEKNLNENYFILSLDLKKNFDQNLLGLFFIFYF